MSLYFHLTGHGAELTYVFHTLENMYSGRERELADTVSRYWGNFVNTGNPNTPPTSKSIAVDVQTDNLVSNALQILTLA